MTHQRTFMQVSTLKGIQVIKSLGGAFLFAEKERRDVLIIALRGTESRISRRTFQAAKSAELGQRVHCVEQKQLQIFKGPVALTHCSRCWKPRSLVTFSQRQQFRRVLQTHWFFCHCVTTLHDHTCSQANTKPCAVLGQWVVCVSECVCARVCICCAP